MRLTLRTLLAYLDDILEPADAREIGAKISESSVAAGMVDRIREVMRRRRITAPELTGPGSGPDPNLVAEYLDNTLAPEAVTEIERVCLESDIHLAEAAGCHQILTIVLGEPVDIPSRTRERMYALGAIAPPPGENGGPVHREPVPPAMADTRRTAAVAAATVQAGDETFAQGLPDYLRRRPLWRRLLPLGVVALLFAWLAFVFYDFRGTFRPETPTAKSIDAALGDDSHAPPAEAVVGVAPESNATAEPAPEPAPAETDAAVAVATESIESGSAAGPGRAVDDPVEPPAPPVAERALETSPAVASAAPAEAPATPDEPAPPAVVENAPPITYTSIEGIALGYDQEENDWNVLERQSSVSPGHWLATPEPFTSRLEVAQGRMAIILNGGTAMQSVAPLEGRLTSLYLDRGRLVLSRPAGDQVSPDPTLVGVHIGHHQFDVELLEPGTLVGVEVLLRQPQGFTGQPLSPAVGGIFVVAGSAAITPTDGARTVMSAENGFLPWPIADGGWQPGPLLATPQWVTPTGPPPASYAKQYERQFPLDQSVSVGIPAIVKDRRSFMSQLAVETLGLTENIPQLLRALQADHDESRQTAIVEVRKWLPRSPENAEGLRDELGRYFRDDEVEPLNELLWGYSQQDLRNLDVSLRLIDWLGHDDVAIRELALFHIKTGANRMTDYHPMAPIVQRQAAIMRLYESVRRQGGLLPPES